MNPPPVQRPARNGLGRGLGSLIPTAPPEQAGSRAEEIGSFNGGPSTQGRHAAA